MGTVVFVRVSTLYVSMDGHGAGSHALRPQPCGSGGRSMLCMVWFLPLALQMEGPPHACRGSEWQGCSLHVTEARLSYAKGF